MALRHHKKIGVTLLELLITISILSVLLCFALVSFDKMMSLQNLDIAASQVAYAASSARYISQKSGYPVQLVMNQNSNTYSILLEDKDITNNDYYGSISGEFPNNIVILANDCGSFSYTVDDSVIDESGYPLSSDCNIRLGYSEGEHKDLLLRMATGSVEYD